MLATHFPDRSRLALIFLGVCACLVLLRQAPGSAWAGEKKTLRYHTAEWRGLTNRDGSGLYHEVVRMIFAARGMDVEATYFPFKRTLLNIQQGLADIAGATNVNEPGILLSRHPIWVTRISAFFHKSHLKGWKGADTLSASPGSGVAPPGMDDLVGLDLYEVPTRKQALGMVLEGRMDYYVDEYAVLQGIESNGARLFGLEEGQSFADIDDFDLTHFVIEDVATVPIYMCFQDNRQGRRLRDIFDEGFFRLHESGRLGLIYAKWNLMEKMPQTLTEQRFEHLAVGLSPPAALLRAEP